MPQHPHHGGDLAFATARHGRPQAGWLDLSTGINPNPYPSPAIDTAALARLPDRGALAGLLDAARAAYGVPASVPLAATPGSEIAIRLLPLIAPPGKVTILGPTYGSHGEAWRAAGRSVADVASPDAVPPDTLIVVLANPNNPDGRILAPDALARLAKRLAASGGLLVVDEAFADVAPEASLAPFLGDTPALVLRSLGKFYGLAGLRLGFVAGPAGLVERLTGLLGDWPVSGLALSIGRTALSDGGWRDGTRIALKAGSAALRDTLIRQGLAIAGGTDLFTLVADGEARRIHQGLAERGIWTRSFDFAPNWLRLGLPPDAAGLARLDQALTSLAER